jgi:hypothetical protein
MRELAEAAALMKVLGNNDADRAEWLLDQVSRLYDENLAWNALDE